MSVFAAKDIKKTLAPKTGAKLQQFFDIHKKIGIIFPIYLIFHVITLKIEIAIATSSLD